MNNKIKKLDIGSIAPFVLFAIFSICIVSVLLTGASLYRKQNVRDNAGYERRTVAQYIATKVRQSDLDGSYFVGDFYKKSPSSEGNSLFLYEDIEGELYYTCIYCYNGYLYELFAEAENNFEPRDGEPIVEVGALKFKNSEGMITTEITYKDGSSRMLCLYPRSSQEVMDYEE